MQSRHEIADHAAGNLVHEYAYVDDREFRCIRKLHILFRDALEVLVDLREFLKLKPRVPLST